MRADSNTLVSVKHGPRHRIPWALLLFCVATPLFAQTVRPLIDENVVKGPGQKASGKIEYVNDTIDAVTVTLEMKSFTVSDTGELSYPPLDPSVHAKLSAAARFNETLQCA